MKPIITAPISALKPKILLYQMAQKEIKNYIVQNNLKPGDSLPPETEFVNLLGVSRTSVREAVKSLETLGILEARPGAGLFVKNFSFDPIIDNMGYAVMADCKELIELLEIRFHLESGMIDQAIQLADDAQINALKNCLKKMEKEAKSGQYSPEIDREFHQILCQNVDNGTLQKILDIFWLSFYQARKRFELSDPSDLLDTYRRHVAIVNALERHDVKAAREAIGDHYRDIEQRWKIGETPHAKDNGKTSRRGWA